jgi:hypothetical protein
MTSNPRRASGPRETSPPLPGDQNARTRVAAWVSATRALFDQLIADINRH